MEVVIICGWHNDYLWCVKKLSNQYWAGRVYDLCVLFYDRNSRRLNRKWFYGEARNPDLILDSNFMVENI